MGLGVDEIRRRGAEDDKPLRMVKTILHELCKLKVREPHHCCNSMLSFCVNVSVWPTDEQSDKLLVHIFMACTLKSNSQSRTILVGRDWRSRRICGTSLRTATQPPSSASMWTSTCRRCTRQGSFQGHCLFQTLLRNQPLLAQALSLQKEATQFLWAACRMQEDLRGNWLRLLQKLPVVEWQVVLQKPLL